MNRIVPLLALLVSACATVPPPATSGSDVFFARLSEHCGKAYAGSLVSNDPRDADWAGKRMVAHWAACDETRVAIALHVEDNQAPDGWNRSRTWLVRRSPAGTLRLHHDHRHADGEPDAVTFYGGDAGGTTGAYVHTFPVDAGSIALFEREGLSASLTNVWRLEVDASDHPAPRFAYQLTRANDPARTFRVAFDLARPVAPPPPAWGQEEP